jgi:hypothetical protein
MRSNLPAALVLALLLVCFALGVVSALATRHPDAQPTPTGLSTPAPAGHADQTAVLILGVDDLQNTAPLLHAIWLATFRPPGREVFMLGLPLDADTGAEQPLRDLFRLSADEGLDPGFLAALEKIIPLHADVIVLLDRIGFAALVDYLGGIDLNDVRLDGSQVMAVMDLVAADPEASLSAQARILEAMTARAPLIGPSPDITPLLDLIPQHAYLSCELAQAVALLSPLLPMQPESVHFDVFTSGHPAASPITSE